MYPIHIMHIFLNMGQLFLQVDQDDIDTFCEENALYYDTKIIKGDYCYIKINEELTDIKSFFSYIENSNAECWRRFIMIGNSSENFLNINSTNPEFIQPVLNTILEELL